MAAFVITSKMTLLGTAWTGTAPGKPGTQTVAGTITTPSDISQFVRSGGEPGWTTAMEAVTNQASGGYVSVIPGLTSGDDLVFECNSAQAAGELDVIVRTTLGGVSRAGSNPVFVDIKPTNAARSTTNPSFVAAVFISAWSPFAGGAGNVASGKLTLTVDGAFGQLVA
jgi:hypothetical protein